MVPRAVEFKRPIVQTTLVERGKERIESQGAKKRGFILYLFIQNCTRGEAEGVYFVSFYSKLHKGPRIEGVYFVSFYSKLHEGQIFVIFCSSIRKKNFVETLAFFSKFRTSEGVIAPKRQFHGLN